MDPGSSFAGAGAGLRPHRKPPEAGGLVRGERTPRALFPFPSRRGHREPGVRNAVPPADATPIDDSRQAAADPRTCDTPGFSLPLGKCHFSCRAPWPTETQKQTVLPFQAFPERPEKPGVSPTRDRRSISRLPVIFGCTKFVSKLRFLPWVVLGLSLSLKT